MAAEVDRHHGAYALAHVPLGVPHVDQPRAGSQSTSTGRGAEVHDGVGARDERQRGDEHLVARADPQHLQRERDARGAGVQAAHVAGARVVGDALLQRHDPGPGRQPSAADGLEHLLDLLLADRRLADAEEVLAAHVGAGVHRPIVAPGGCPRVARHLSENAAGRPELRQPGAVVHDPQRPRDRFGGEPLATSPARARPAARPPQARGRVRERGGVARRVARLLGHDAREPARVGRRHRQPGGHRLERGEREDLGEPRGDDGHRGLAPSAASSPPGARP